MRIQHQEHLPPSRKLPTKKVKREDGANGSTSAQPATTLDEDIYFAGASPYLNEGLLDSSLSMFDPALLAIGTPVPSTAIASGSGTPTPFALKPATAQAPLEIDAIDEDEEDVDSPEMSEAIAANPTLAADHVRYLCMLARHRYACQERDLLHEELASLQVKREQLFREKDGMVDEIFAAELGEEAESLLAPLQDEEIPTLKWQLANRTSLPQVGVRDWKEIKSRNQAPPEDEEE